MKKNKIKVFKIKKNMKYSLKQYAVYSVLACYTDKSKVSHISREILAKLSGVKDLDTISKYTGMFERDGLISKKSKFTDTGNRIVEYKILEPTSGYTLCTNKLFSGNSELIGFLCLLAEYKIGNTNKIRYTDSALIEKMGISRPTFKKYMKLAIQDGSVIKTDDGYILSEEIFPVTSDISQQARSKINSILMDNNGSRAKKTLLTYYNPNTDEFEGLKGSIEDFLDYCLAGVPKKAKKKPTKEEIKVQF